LPLDQEGRYGDVKKLTPAERKRFEYTRTYKLTLLLHYSPASRGIIFCLWVGIWDRGMNRG